MTQTVPSPAPSNRRVYVDAMKGLGIILVVWGHFEEYYRGTSPVFNGTFECMYLFHMALFCLCSGMVAKLNGKKLVLQQVWLYLLCQALLLPFRSLVLQENLAEAGGVLAAWLLPWRHMWYLYALIFWELTVPLLTLLRDRLGVPGKWLGLAAAVAVGLAAGTVDWPFSLTRVFSFYPYYAAGVLFRQEIDRWFQAAQKKRLLTGLAAVILVAFYGWRFAAILRAPEPVYEGARIFHDVAYGEGYAVSDRALTYLIGLVTAVALIAVLGRVRLLADLGRRTLPIYILHMPVYAFLVQLGTYEAAGGKGALAVAGWVFLAAGGCVCLFGSRPAAAVFDWAANLWYKKLPALWQGGGRCLKKTNTQR